MNMKKLLFAIMLLISFTSCYTTKTLHGNINEYTTVKEVSSKRNNILFWGLYNNDSGIRAKSVIHNDINYMVKTQFSPVDYLLTIITLGIYSPNTTKIYLPTSGREREYCE